MRVEVVVPEEYMADGVRRPEFPALRRFREPRTARRRNVIRVEVPLAEMFGYATDLRSRTQGRASFTMHFSHYAETPVVGRRGSDRQGDRQGGTVE